MFLKNIILIFFACLSQTKTQSVSRTITIPQGPVRGYKTPGSEVFEFFGIPYATAPTASERFKAPLPPPTWVETLEAVENNIACQQSSSITSHLNVREDCLVANVYVPSTETANLPVVVLIHGGAYTQGSGNGASPKPLVESQRIAAVTFNYRLGVHGFLCLGTEDVPGNAGLRDMIAALRWVKENIAHFGGNPKDVTLAGCSSGASSADLLSLSKAAKGLFNKLIINSSAHVAAWSVQLDPIKNAQDHALKLNFTDINSLSNLEEFYKSISYELLVSDTSSLHHRNADIVFVPCIENDLGQEMIIEDSPINVIKSSEYTNLPTLYGFANMEGIFRMSYFDEWAPAMNGKFSDFLTLDLNFENDNEKEELAQTVKEFYFGSNNVGLNTLFDYINYFTDVMFANPILRSIRLQAEAGNERLFLYEYSFYNKDVPVAGVPDVLTNFPGATHCAQTHTVLERVIDSEESHTEEYKQVRENMRELWINFITTGYTYISAGSPCHIKLETGCVARNTAPLPPPTWVETLEAVDNNIACQQPSSPTTSHLNVREDCLVANIYVPSTETTNLPVVVFIHGGAYTEGSGTGGSPKPLLESQRIAAVTFNYRLGVHGFLCLGTEDVPGNAGLRDIIAALRWVKENIAHFGGNPEDVTLAGYSSGASSADLLNLSRAAEGLFNKVIIDSGAHVAAWSVQLDPIKNAQDHALKLNFTDKNSISNLEEFYKSISYELLVSDTSHLHHRNADLVFVPCIENNLGQEMIIEDSPINVIKSSEYLNLPTLYGFSNMEGIFRMSYFDEWAPAMNEKFSDFLTLDLNFENDNEKEELAQTVKEFYFGSNNVGLYTLFDYINYFSDVMFANPMLRSIRLQAEAGNERLFLYEYSFYNVNVPVAGVPDVLTNFPRAHHCAQTAAVLESVFDNKESYTEEYKQVREKMRELWVNFITTGTPVPVTSSFPSWPPANASRSPHMSLGSTFELKGALNERRALFWDSIYERYQRYPIPPYELNSANTANVLFVSIVLNFAVILYNL